MLSSLSFVTAATRLRKPFSQLLTLFMPDEEPNVTNPAAQDANKDQIWNNESQPVSPKIERHSYIPG